RRETCGGARRLIEDPGHAAAVSLVIRRPGLTVPVRIDATGASGPTKGRAQGSNWRRSSPGLYVPAEAERSLAQDIVEVAAGLPVGAAITGWAALYWMGAPYQPTHHADGTRAHIEVAIGDHAALQPRRGVTTSGDWLLPGDVIDVDGLPVTRPERSVSYAARRAWSLDLAVRIIDMAALGNLVDVAALRRYVTRLGARPGVVQLRDAVDLADENSWSPMETHMRLRWSDAVRRRPLTNRPIFDAYGIRLCTPDLFDPVLGVVGEYDGEVHDESRVRARDLTREELYRDLGFEVARMIAVDRRSAQFEGRLHAAYRRAAARPLRGGWTLEPPPGWVDTTSVARRRELSPEARARWAAARC
ncbi:hypothetical protein, partial [Nocardioides sp.]|uniref:hypothetical protein n=1 Tax=Nocardioides sp. TaxID=35761 RepID=UPI0035158151